MVINFNKKRRRVALGILIAAIICVIWGLSCKGSEEAFNVASKEERNNYIIDVVFYDDKKILKCNQNITYINKSDKNLDKLYLHIYPNAFSKEEFAPFEKIHMKEAYPNGFDSGYLDIENILNNKTKLKYNITGDKNDILEVVLDKELGSFEKCSIDIKYTVKLPNCLGRFGYGENTINITNWFPICCVYDEDWSTISYETIGDPFYSDISDFTVNVLIPKRYELASTGTLVEEEVGISRKLCRLQARDVRDFAIILSDKFIVNKDIYENTSILSYSLNKSIATTANKYAKEAVGVFSEMFGKYPYDTYSVVASDFFIGGMEYPNLVMIDERLYNKHNMFLLEYVIAHETAHQWWYGVVGNNEVEEPWIDEALTEYSTVMYFEKKYGEKLASRMLKTMQVQCENYKGKDLFRASNDFESSSDYSLNIYTKGAVIFSEIRNTVGDKLFFDTLKKYYDEYRFENVSREEFIKFWNIQGIDIEKIIDKLD